MITEEFIQAEYERFCSGKLYFEIIFPDTFKYLVCRGVISTSEEQLETAVRIVAEYRRDVFRKWYFGKDKPLRDNNFPHIDTEAGRINENTFRMILAQKLLVYQWYEEQKAKGVNKLFLELQNAV